MTQNIPRVQLSVDSPDAAANLEAAVGAFLARRDHTSALIVDLDGEHLPTAIVSALIASLRQLREVGGAIAINATDPGAPRRAGPLRPGPRLRPLTLVRARS